MELGEKLQHLREVEGQLRGLGRPLSQAEVVRLMRRELGRGVSHGYLSQLEGGARLHLSATSRDLLARFFKVHPGYLVSDPPGFQRAFEPSVPPPDLATWLAQGDRFWYRNLGAAGSEFVLLDAASGAREPA